jgi:hypothetical protein
VSTVSGIGPLNIGSIPRTSQAQAMRGVDVRQAVEQVASAVLEQTLHQMGKEPSENTSRLSRLEQIDPTLARNYQALLDFIAQQDPEAAESLNRLLDGFLNAAAGFGSGGAPAGKETAAPSSEQFQIALEATYVQLRAETADGTVVTAERVEVVFSAQLQRVQGSADPLVLDLNGDGFETTTAEYGHDFDLNADGRIVRAATVTGGDALLVYDRNRNGLIDDGSELFGDQNGATDGFAELARYDQNQDGWIDASDDIYALLGVFQDRNRNGRTDAGELQRLADINIAALQLHAQKVDGDSNGNRIDSVAVFRRTDGSEGLLGELYFNYLA